jgi:7-alpha-hydroxysteroid dehydrogenase
MSILGLFRMEGEVALITGGGGGLGSAIALAFADCGADVAVVGRTAAPLEKVRAEVEARGRKCVVIARDVTSPGGADAMVEDCIRAFGKLTVLVNNVGGIAGDERPLPALEMTDESWAAQIELNLNSVWRLTKAAVPRMTSGGSIINMSSIKAFDPAGGSGAYGAAKAALNNLTLALAGDLAPRIRVNAIAPGPVPTEAFRSKRNVTEADFPRVAKEWGIPLGRLGTPNDVASVALLLASPAGSWITGQTIVVAGGM